MQNILCYVMLCYVMLYCIVLYYIVLHTYIHTYILYTISTFPADHTPRFLMKIFEREKMRKDNRFIDTGRFYD